MKLKKIFTNFRVIILIIALLFAIIAIRPNFGADGVAIRNVIDNSSAYLAGIENPRANIQPMDRERIIAINNIPITNLEDYYNEIGKFKPDMTYTIRTTKILYRITTREAFETIILNETEEIIFEEEFLDTIIVNGTEQNITSLRNVTQIVNKTIVNSLGLDDIGLRVYDAPNTNIRKGLDLEGGTRVLLKPEDNLSDDMFDLLIDNMKQRLNVYGLSDIVIRNAGDFFSDARYIVVEIAGVNEEEVKNLISQQGKFEAKIGDEVTFIGGEGDVTYVCRTPDCSGIDPYQGCGQLSTGEWSCRFRFSISLKTEASQRQARITDKLSIVTIDEEGNAVSRDNQYLNETLDLYLDNKLVDSLNIGADLKGKVVSDISISGSGIGNTQQEAVENALTNMKKLQTLLITGSLPSKLDIVKSDNLSPQLGEEFLRNALLIGVLSIIAVSLVVFIRYRRWEIFIPMTIVMVSEVILILGFAALLRQNLDLAAIAGIIIAVGTGIDHQIVIIDETLRKENKGSSWKERLKRAFFIIMAAYFTTLVAMIPLIFAGAGLLRGFAIATIAGVTFGVFITRPAFGAIFENLIKDEEE
jgi:preprotein translocase subunit SecD